MIVKYLIDIGVDINYVDNFNNNAYHYLFSSIIKNYNQIKQKNLIPATQNLNNEKIIMIKNIKNEIFDNVINKNNSLSPELEMIENTIKLSIGNSVNAKNIVIKFQEELNKLISDTENFNKTDLFNVMLNEFVRLIQSNWRSFPKSGLIKIHNEETYSEPKGDPSGFSVIQNTDYLEFIKNECNKIITNLVDDVLKENREVELVDLDDMKNEILKFFIKNNYKLFHSPPDLEIDCFNDSVNQNHDKFLIEYEKHNLLIHSNCIDNADNIIDYKLNTFAGGSRQVSITNPFNIDGIDKLFSIQDDDKIIKILINTINVKSDYSTYNFEESYNHFLSNDTFPEGILNQRLLEYIYSISNGTQTDIEQKENDLIKKIKNKKEYILLKKIIEKRSKFNPGHYLYIFCCTYKSIKNIEDGESNLKLELNQGIVLLCSALYNNQGNILQSIKNVFKPLKIDEIIKTNGENSDADNYSDFIKELLIIGDEPDDKLEKIIKYTKDFFNGTPIEIDVVENMTECEKLGYYIINYYQNMKYKPLIQNIVDFLVLIRLYQIRNINNDDDNDKLNNFSNRLRSLYLIPKTFDDIKI